MKTEQQLIEAFAAADSYQPSDDLWQRVVHSIDEDRAHRRRLLSTLVWVALTALVAVAIALLSIESVNGRARVNWQDLEALEAAILVALTLALAPAIRRLGRGYAEDMFVSSPATGLSLLKLLDVAYYLVATGYLLITTRLGVPTAYQLIDAGDQLEDAVMRIGGLLLLLGLLHALNLMALPLIALVFNSTRRGVPLPRWINVILVLAGLAAGWNIFWLVLGTIGGRS